MKAISYRRFKDACRYRAWNGVCMIGDDDRCFDTVEQGYLCKEKYCPILRECKEVKP